MELFNYYATVNSVSRIMQFTHGDKPLLTHGGCEAYRAAQGGQYLVKSGIIVSIRVKVTTETIDYFLDGCPNDEGKHWHVHTRPWKAFTEAIKLLHQRGPEP